MNKAIELALRTWYPKDHPLHMDPLHPAMGLVGEVGEWINKHKKDKYKPGFEFSREDELDELGDIWYYLRILMYQFEIKLYETLYKPIELSSENALDITMAEFSELSTSIFVSDNDTFIKYAIYIFYEQLRSYLIFKNANFNELTALNWEKLKDGSERGEEWKKAWK